MLNLNLSEFSDGLPFPLLASTLIIGANFTSSKVLYNSRPLLKTFSNQIGKLEHPERMLWLTDTFDDKNGVSMVLKEMHKEIKQQDLPIDIMVCSNTIKPDDHLIVVEPLVEFSLPFYKDQSFRIPNLHKIHDLFLNNEYDRIICSTEGVMGAIALYLKNAYTVPASFYIHTDWVMFAKKVLKLDTANLDRVRRFLRAYYSGFDHLFVLNTDHQKWLTGPAMGFDVSKVYITAHWADDKFKPIKTEKEKLFGVKPDDQVLLFAGRLSNEKGVNHLADIYDEIKKEIPNIRFVFAGTGPEEDNLKKKIHEGVFLGWVDNNKLPEIYSAADLLALPSKFDTFSCVVLESLSCGTPVVAYKTKGPKDIISHNQCGYLATGKKDMAAFIVDYMKNAEMQKTYKTEAIQRAKFYQKNIILDQFLQDVGLRDEPLD